MWGETRIKLIRKGYGARAAERGERELDLADKSADIGRELVTQIERDSEEKMPVKKVWFCVLSAITRDGPF